MGMKEFTFEDLDYRFTVSLPRKPKKGERIQHGGEEYIFQTTKLVDGVEVCEVRGPKTLQAGLDGMQQFAELQAKARED
jgi:hypothetical protein